MVQAGYAETLESEGGYSRPSEVGGGVRHAILTFHSQDQYRSNEVHIPEMHRNGSSLPALVLVFSTMTFNMA